MKISDLSLAKLYARPKITPTIEIAIRDKEDFSKIQPEYCEKVCKLKCKAYHNVLLSHTEVDVLIVQDHNAIPDGYKDAQKLERTNRTIIQELCTRNLKGLRYKLVSAFKCELTSQDLPKRKPPTTSVQSKCAPYFLEEVKRSKPKVIISLGGNVTRALGLKKSNYENRGEVYGNVILTLHPKITLMIRQNSSGKMWGSDYWEIIDRDFNKAGRIARGELVVPDLDKSIEREKSNIRIARSLKDVRDMVNIMISFPKDKVLSLDTETTGLDPWAVDAKLLTIQFGFRSSNGNIISFVIPLWHRENNGYNADEAWNYIVPILICSLPKIGHNIKFDILYIFATKGIRVCNIIYDTMLVLHSMNSGVQGNYGLKRAVWDWIPESGLGGYEDKLPKLSRIRKNKKELEEDGEETEIQS